MSDKPYYPPCFAPMSGGKDSITTAEVLARSDRLLGCVALKTGISTPDWRDFVVDFCRKRGWSLEFYETENKYEDLILKYGFPGPGWHNRFMNYLKGRGVANFKRAHPNGILASGVRLNESARRFINTKPVSMWERTPILAPIYDWTTESVWAFFRSCGFQRSPAYETLKISGDCLCGAMAEEDELEKIHYHYPAIGKMLDDLSWKIRDKFPHRSEWGWGWDQEKKKSAREAAICAECGDTAPFIPGIVKTESVSDERDGRGSPSYGRVANTPLKE